MRHAGLTAAIMLGGLAAVAHAQPAPQPAQTATPAPDGSIYISADGLVARDPAFERVIAAPDEPELNLDYARERADAGDLLSAVAAVERLLLNQPDWHAARLFYAALLYRLDDIQDMRRELDLLEGRNLNPTQRAEVGKLRRLIARRSDDTLLTGQLSVGLAYDSDAVGALANAVDLNTGIPFSDDGLAVLASAGLSVTHKLAADGSRALYATAGLITKTDISGVDQRYARFEGAAGVAFKLGATAVRAGGVYRYLAIFGDGYLDEYGGRIETTTKLSPRTALTGNLEVVDQAYDEPASLVPLPVPDGRDGLRVDVGLGVTYRLTNRQSFGVEIGYEDKAAEFDALAYAGPRFYAAYTALLGRGGYANLTGTVRVLDYDGLDPLTGVARHDTRYFVRGALGAPFSAFTAAGSTGDYREALRLEGALSFAARESRAPYLDYDSVGAEVRMIYRFGE